MSNSTQSAAFGIGGVGILIAIAAVAFRAAPVTIQPAEKVAIEAARGTRGASVPYSTLGVVALDYAHGRELLAEYLGRDWEELARGTHQGRRIPLRIVIATLADPFDSYLDWSFDANVEALRRAFGTAGYVPQSYWLPDRRDSLSVKGGIGAGTYSTHDFQPGVFLFRSTTPDSISLALLYVVPELPSSGLRRRAFEAALRDRAAIMGIADGPFSFSERERSQLSVLGPTFSGSSSSLRMLLDSLPSQIDSRTCASRIVSGSATSFSNQRVLSDPTPSRLGAGKCAATTASAAPGVDSNVVPHLSFSATVNTDEAMDESLSRLVARLGVTPSQVAILSESGTQYGALEAKVSSKAEQSAKIDSAPKPLNGFLTVTFPMNIGSLRAEYARSPGAAPSPGVPQLGEAPRTRVGLDDNERPREFPADASRLTVPTADVVLSAALRELREHGIRLVVVRATDVRDKLMLVGELRRNLRDVIIVLYENNVLLRHPEFSSTMRGSLVLSTYPMLLENQFWSTSARRGGRTYTDLRNLTSFPNDASIGVYNAALTLLDHPEERIEYELRGIGSGNQKYTQPPVWLSVIGSDGFYPLRADTVSEAHKKYVSPAPLSSVVTAPSDQIHEHAYGTRGVAQLLMLTTPALLFAVAMILMSFGTLIPGNYRQHVPKVFGPPANGRQRFFLCLFGISLSVSYLPFAVAVDARQTVESLETFASALSAELWIVMIALATGMGASIAGAFLTRRGVVDDARRSVRVPQGLDNTDELGRNIQTTPAARGVTNGVETRSGTTLGFVLIGFSCAAFAVGALGYAEHLVTLLKTNGIESAFVWYRTLHLTSGVSPITPLVLLGVAFAAWTWWQLQQSRIFDESNPLETALARLAIPGSGAIWSRSYRAIEQARRGLTWFAPGPLVFLIAMTLLVAMWFVLRSRTPTLERIADPTGANWSFDLALWIGILSLVTASAWAIYRLLHAWNGVERFLDIVAGTPVASAFGRLPLDIARLTDVGFLGFRRDTSSDGDYLEQLWARAIEDVEGAAKIQTEIEELAKKASAVTDPLKVPHLVAVSKEGALTVGSMAPSGLPTPEALILKDVNARISTLMSQAKWSRPASATSVQLALQSVLVAWEAARTRPDPFKELPIEEPKIAMPNARALRTIEEYIAFEILLYTEMYLLNLRRLCFFLFASLLVLVIISGQYPYEPHSVVSIATITLLLATVGVIFFVIVRMSRSSTLSRIAHTEPGKVTWDASFVLKLLTFCVIPIITLVSSEFPEVRSLLFAWVDPLARTMGRM